MTRSTSDTSAQTIANAADRLEGGGASGEGQFVARPGAQLLCLSCRQELPADGLPADEVERVEGESDPADMAIVVPVACPHCGARGTFTAKYGPEASEDETEILLALDRHPS